MFASSRRSHLGVCAIRIPRTQLISFTSITLLGVFLLFNAACILIAGTVAERMMVTGEDGDDDDVDDPDDVAIISQN